jgi:hypothetical protein
VILPRISLWRDGRHSNDYRFFDRNIAEFMNASGTGVLVHKYLGPIPQPGTGDLTKPGNATQSELNIQDLLFLENRDRKYEENVYKLRGCYQVADNSFDLSQFGLFLQTGTLYMTFHLTEMVNAIGRKIMNGDVLELQHLVDYETLDPNLPAALKRFFVVSDCTRGAEGYSPTWWPHIWRCKINPLVDSQEYRDIINKITVSEDNNTPIREIMSTYNKYTQINDAIVEQAEIELPQSGYDTTPIYHRSVDEYSANFSVNAYLGSTDTAPNGENVTQSVAFPADPDIGDYCLRVDFVPNRLFRWDGVRWRKIEDKVRTNITNNSADNKTQRNSFITNTNTYVDVYGNTQPQKQSLHNALKPKAD